MDECCYRFSADKLLVQLCPTCDPRAACSLIEGFVLPSLGLGCSKSNLYTDNLSLV